MNTKKEEIASIIGESVHMALRKFADSKESAQAYNAIREMGDEEWHGICIFVAEATINAVTEKEIYKY